MAALVDPFELAFRAAADDGSAVRSEREWQALTRHLTAEALVVREDEQLLLEDLWLTAQAEARAYGQSGAPELTLERLQEHLREHFCGAGTKLGSLDKRVEGALSGMAEQLGHLRGLLAGWDLDGLDDAQAYQLLALLDAVEARREEAAAAATTLGLAERERLARDRIEALLTPNDDADPGDESSAIIWQRENVTLVERALAKGRPKPGSYRVLGSKSKARTLTQDAFNLSGGYIGRFGVGIARAEVTAKDGASVPAVAVVVPGAGDGNALAAAGVVANGARRGVLHAVAGDSEVVVPAAARAAVLRQLRALRELAFCKYTLQFLTVDTLHSEGDLVVLYEHFGGRPVATLLGSTRDGGHVASPLEECGALFRHWASEVAAGLGAIHRMCTHAIATPRLTLDHVIIGGRGVSVKLGGFDFGDSLTDLEPGSSMRGGAATPAQGIHEREKRFVADLGRVLGQMLGLDTEAAVDGISAGACTEARARDGAGLALRVGQVLTLELAPCRTGGGRWRRPSFGSRGAPALLDLDAKGSSVHLPTTSSGSKIRLFGLRPGDAVVRLSGEGQEDPEDDILPRRSLPGEAFAFAVEVLPAAVSPELGAILEACALVEGNAPVPNPNPGPRPNHNPIPNP